MSSRLWRAAAWIGAGAACLPGASQAWDWLDSTPQARLDADHFILEKLRAQHGATWERVGKEFMWDYEFRGAGCELTVSRTATDGDTFTLVLPLDQMLSYWRHDAAISFYCADDAACATQRVTSAVIDSEERRIGQASLLVPDPNDLPKVADAFNALHQLCDDAYRDPDRDSDVWPDSPDESAVAPDSTARRHRARNATPP